MLTNGIDRILKIIKNKPSSSLTISHFSRRPWPAEASIYRTDRLSGKKVLNRHEVFQHYQEINNRIGTRFECLLISWKRCQPGPVNYVFLAFLVLDTIFFRIIPALLLTFFSFWLEVDAAAALVDLDDLTDLADFFETSSSEDCKLN